MSIMIVCGVIPSAYAWSITFSGATTVGSYCRRPVQVRGNTDNLPIRAGTLRVMYPTTDITINTWAYGWYAGFNSIQHLAAQNATVAPYNGLNTIGWNFSNTAPVNPLQTTNGIITNFRYRSAKGTGTVTIEWYVINTTWSAWDYSMFSYQITPSDPILNIMTGQTPLNVSLVQTPCIEDITAPTIVNTTPTAGSFAVAQGLYTGWFTIYDRLGSQTDSDGNNTIHYRFNPTLSPANYVPAPSTVDNQIGVNSWSLAVRIVWGTNLLASSFNYVLSGTSLIRSSRAGNGSINALTWNRNQRGYDVSFVPLIGYGIEQPITISITGSDLSGNTTTTSYSFNAPQNPIINVLTPAWPNGSIARTDRSVRSGSTQLSFNILDTRAWVDTGTVSMSISSSSGVYVTELLTGSRLSFQLIAWSVWAGNSWWYLVSWFSNQNFPIGSIMTVTITGQDLAGNIISTNFQFTIRQSCDYYGCSELLTLNFLWNSSLDFEYIHNAIYVTGSDIPYITLSGNVLNCGLQSDIYTGVLLTGNVAWATLYSYNGRYTGQNLYITGWTIIYNSGTKTFSVIPN